MVGEALLSPTRTYAPILQKIFESVKRDQIHGIVHCTGGGQQKCRGFGKGITYIKDNLFPTPDLFQLIANLNYMELNEMYKVFNMGHLLEIFCERKTADKLIEISKSFGVNAQIVGYCEKSIDGNNKVIIKNNGNIFEY